MHTKRGRMGRGGVGGVWGGGRETDRENLTKNVRIPDELILGNHRTCAHTTETNTAKKLQMQSQNTHYATRRTRIA